MSIALKLNSGDPVLLVCDRRYRHSPGSLLYRPFIARFEGETCPGEVHHRIMNGLRSQGALYDAVRLIEFRGRLICRNRIERFFLRLGRDGTLRDHAGHRVWIEAARRQRSGL